MPQVFIPRVMRSIIIAHTPELSQMLNILHTVTLGSGVLEADCVAVNGLLAGWIASDYSTIFAANIVIDAVHTRSMEGLLVPQHTTPLAQAGAMSGDTLPYPTSLPVEFSTGLTGRRNKGEFHPFPPVEDVNTSEGIPTLLYAGQVQTAMDNLIHTMSSGDYPLVVASFRYESFRAITTAIAGSGWGTVVRRKVGRGR